MVVPVVEMLDIGQISLRELGRQGPAEISNDSDGVVEAGKLVKVHGKGIHLIQVGHTLDERRVGQHHFVVVLELNPDVPFDLCLLVGAAFDQI